MYPKQLMSNSITLLHYNRLLLIRRLVLMLTSGTTLSGTVTTWDCSMSSTTGLPVYSIAAAFTLQKNYRRLMQLSRIKSVEGTLRICYHKRVNSCCCVCTMQLAKSHLLACCVLVLIIGSCP